ATLKTVGTQSLTVTDTVSPAITGAQTGIVVNPATAASFTVAGFPSPTTAGIAGSFTVTAKDGFGNTATGYTGTVHFTSNDAAATLPANSAFTGGAAGVHPSTATPIRAAGRQTLTATDTVTAALTGQQAITINPAAASSLLVSGYGSPRTAGSAGSFTVTARD